MNDHTRPVYIPEARPSRTRNTLAFLGWIAAGSFSVAMVLLSLLAINQGPEANQPAMMVCALAWTGCAWLSARGAKRRGL